MRKKRKKIDDLTMRLFTTYPDTEEYRLLQIEVRERVEAHRKKQAESECASEQGLPANSLFQEEIISLVNQIVEKQNDLDKAINELNVKLKALS